MSIYITGDIHGYPIRLTDENLNDRGVALIKDDKLIICGDVAQIHHSTSEKMLMNGVTYARARYFDWERCANIYLTEQMRNVVAEYETEHYRRAYRRIGLF